MSDLIPVFYFFFHIIFALSMGWLNDGGTYYSIHQCT